jgi:hypothetical protein
LDLNLFDPGPLHQDVVTDSDTADVSARIGLSPALSLDLRVGVAQTTDGVQNVPVDGPAVIVSEVEQTHPTGRVGFVYRLGEGRVARLAYQRWLRSASDSTLAPIATAGMAPDDRLLAPNGLSEGGRAQLDWTWNSDTFLTAFTEYQQLTNPSTFGEEFESVPHTSQWAIQRLARTMLGHSAIHELYQPPLPFREGYYTAGGFGWNYLLDPEWAVRTRYTFTSGHTRDTTDSVFVAPILPRHAFSFGGTWTSSRRLQAGADFSYISAHRVSSIDPTIWNGHWETSLDASWEPRNKQWSVAFTGRNLGGASTNYFESVTYGISVRYRY